MLDTILIARDECFSPHSEEKDLAILQAVGRCLTARGYNTTVVREDVQGEALRILQPSANTLYASMGRHKATLAFLRKQEQIGMKVVNSTKGVEICFRRVLLEQLMQREGFPMPADEGYGYWVKRGDASSQSSEDVAFAADVEELDRAIRRFHQRGIRDVVVSSHVPGDVVKFYGVEGADFFRVFYPTDDGVTKFGDEERNGSARHYPFDVERLRQEAERLSRLTGVPVYGGDAVVTEQGQFCIIDFNDWPSYSRCREAAAEAIAYLLDKHV